MPNKDEGYWFTTDTGVHIHVNPGESKEDALRRRFGRVNGKKENITYENLTDNRFGKQDQKLDGTGSASKDIAIDLYIDARAAGDTKTADAIANRHKQYEQEYANSKSRTYTVSGTTKVEPDIRYNNATKPYYQKWTYSYEQNPASTRYYNDITKMKKQFYKEQNKKNIK